MKNVSVVHPAITWCENYFTAGVSHQHPDLAAEAQLP